MSSSSEALEKRKVRACVAWYKKSHPEEYKMFVAQMKFQRDNAISEFAQVEGSPHRMIHELPETMFDFMVGFLSVEEMKWFSTIESSRWFAKTFPEFSAARTI